MPFEIGEVFKHKNNTDVALLVTGLSGSLDKVFVRGMWVNIVNPNNPFFCSMKTDRIEIPLAECKEWEKIYVTTAIQKVVS
jgi:hypothetical protein